MTNLIKELLSLNESQDGLDEKSFDDLCKAINTGLGNEGEVYNCEGFDDSEVELLGGGAALATLYLKGEFKSMTIKVTGFHVYGSEDDDMIEEDGKVDVTIDLTNAAQVKSEGKKIGVEAKKVIKAAIREIKSNR